jgi:branched-chain amino acid transport system substrate-binding protein
MLGGDGSRWLKGTSLTIARRRRVALLGAAMVMTACGTRLPDEAFVRPGPVIDDTANGADAPAASGPGDDSSDGAPLSSQISTPVAGEVPEGSEASGSASPTGAAGPNQASDVGVTATSLRIGTIVAENGVLGDQFAPSVWGLRAWVEDTNARGGIAGRKLELFTCDDREDRARSLECARRLVEQDKVFALIATNTRSLGGAAPYLAAQGIPVVGQPINNSFYRYPTFFASYGSHYPPRDGKTVGDNGTLTFLSTPYRYYRDQLGIRTAAVFQYDIAESKQAATFFRAALEAEGIRTTSYTISFAAPAFDAPVADMQRNGVQLVLDALDGGANRRLCDTMDRRGFVPVVKSTTVAVVGDDFPETFTGGCRTTTYVPHNALPYTDSSKPFIARFRAGMAKYQRGKRLHQWELEAWVMGQMLQDYLVSAGPTPTRAGFIENLSSYHRSTVGGIMTPDIDFEGDAKAPTVADCTYIYRWDDAAGRWVDANHGLYCIDDAKQVPTPAAENGA